MKAEKLPLKFSPVLLTLETQVEVDAIFAFLNHCTLTDAVGLGDSGSFEALEEFRDRHNCDKLHSALCKLVKAAKST